MADRWALLSGGVIAAQQSAPDEQSIAAALAGAALPGVV